MSYSLFANLLDFVNVIAHCYDKQCFSLIYIMIDEDYASRKNNPLSALK